MISDAIEMLRVHEGRGIWEKTLGYGLKRHLCQKARQKQFRRRRFERKDHDVWLYASGVASKSILPALPVALAFRSNVNSTVGAWSECYVDVRPSHKSR